RLHFLRNGRAGVTDREINPAVFGTGRYVDAAAAPVVLPSVLEKVLQDERSVTFFADDRERRRKVRHHLELERIGQSIEIIEPFLDKLVQIDQRKLDPQVSSIHPRQEEQI